jgi:Holliday junction resolvase RusA-like endonuclease
MNTSIKLTFEGEPRAIQSFRFGTGIKSDGKSFISRYQPSSNTKWKKYISLSAKSQLPVGFKPMDGSIILSRAVFVFAPLKGLKAHEHKAIEMGYYVRKDTAPDLTDNLFKGLIDALAKIVFTMDSRICQMEGAICKCYGKNPRIELEFREASSSVIQIHVPSIEEIDFKKVL